MQDTIIFLDIDGVLNGHEWCHIKSRPSLRINQGPIAILNEILTRVVCDVVMSTTWSRHVEDGDCILAGARWMFETHGARVPVVDAICGHIVNPNERANRIRQWVSDNNPKRWIAIDDLPLTLDEQRLVRPNPAIGLEPRHASEVVKKLESQSA